MKPNILTLTILGSLVLGGVVVFNQLNENNSNSISLEYSAIPNVFGDPNRCSMSLDEALSSSESNFKVPNSMPSNYQIQDAFGEKGQVILYFATSPICGEGVSRTYEDGIIRFIAANSESTKATRISEGEEYFKEYRANAPIPEKINLFEINGISAMGWESGIRKSQYIDSDSGKIIHEEDIPHPAQIRMIDSKNNLYYSITGYLPLDQLKTIMSDSIN